MILSQKCALVQEIQLGSPDCERVGSGDKTRDIMSSLVQTE